MWNVDRSRDRLKALWWDRNGYCVLYKRAHRAVFVLPASEPGAASVRIEGRVLGELLAGKDKSQLKRTKLHIVR